jgi:hypothetical protein
MKPEAEEIRSLLEKHPLPWANHGMLIRDALGKQVIHVGGSQDEYSRRIPGDQLVAMNAMIVRSVNSSLRVRRPDADLIQQDAHTPGGWAWEFQDKDCTRPVVLAAESNDVLLLTDDDSGEPIMIVGDFDQSLIEHAHQVPHKCKDENCQGNQNRRKLELLKLFVDLLACAEPHLDELTLRPRMILELAKVRDEAVKLIAE